MSEVASIKVTKNEEDLSQVFSYDAILDHIGQLGTFQLLTCVLLCFPIFFADIASMCYIFTGAVPEYR